MTARYHCKYGCGWSTPVWLTRTDGRRSLGWHRLESHIEHEHPTEYTTHVERVLLEEQSAPDVVLGEE